MDSPATILVIDDSPFVFKMVKKAVEPAGYQVVGNASNGKQGLEMIESLKPDLITLDITMPVMDGLETARALFQKQPDSKVLMLSAMGDDELIQEARGLGVKHFLTKPFKPEILLDAIKKL